jgi:hypothetical protein
MDLATCGDRHDLEELDKVTVQTPPRFPALPGRGEKTWLFFVIHFRKNKENTGPMESGRFRLSRVNRYNKQEKIRPVLHDEQRLYRAVPVVRSVCPDMAFHQQAIYNTLTPPRRNFPLNQTNINLNNRTLKYKLPAQRATVLPPHHNRPYHLGVTDGVILVKQEVHYQIMRG